MVFQYENDYRSEIKKLAGLFAMEKLGNNLILLRHVSSGMTAFATVYSLLSLKSHFTYVKYQPQPQELLNPWKSTIIFSLY